MGAEVIEFRHGKLLIKAREADGTANSVMAALMSPREHVGDNVKKWAVRNQA